MLFAGLIIVWAGPDHKPFADIRIVDCGVMPGYGREESAAPAAPVEVNLDKIPGLDDDFDPVPAAAARPRPSAAGLKPGQKPGEAAEGGLLGGLTSGLSGLASGGAAGAMGKVGDLTGGAGAAAGGAMKAAGGLFKKFGF